MMKVWMICVEKTVMYIRRSFKEQKWKEQKVVGRGIKIWRKVGWKSNQCVPRKSMHNSKIWTVNTKPFTGVLKVKEGGREDSWYPNLLKLDPSAHGWAWWAVVVRFQNEMVVHNENLKICKFGNLSKRWDWVGLKLHLLVCDRGFHVN